MEFGHGASDSLPILRKGYRGILKVNQLMPVDETPSLTPIHGTAHTMMKHPTCETLEMTVYSWVGIQTQARQLSGECGLCLVYLLHNANHGVCSCFHLSPVSGGHFLRCV